MSTTTGIKGRRKAEPIFITKSEMARALGIHPGTITRWIGKGEFPPPHSRPGERTSLWLRSHFEAYVRDGRWPEKAYAPALTN
jgi:predicted DNA-binding transcriptional regulator AlpA